MKEPLLGRRRVKRMAVIFCTILLIITAVLFLIPLYALHVVAGQRVNQTQFNSLDFGIESERITLTTSDGLNLAAWRTYSETDTPSGTIIIISGIRNPSVTAFFGYSEWLSTHGWDSLLIEMRARSLSEGDRFGLRLTEWMDVAAGVGFLETDERAGHLPIVAMGTSMGGATVLTAAAELPRIDGVISLSAFSSIQAMYSDYMGLLGIPSFLATLTTPFMYVNIGLRFGFGEISRTPDNAVRAMAGRPVLLMHSTEDWEVPFSNFEQLYQSARDGNALVNTFVREGNWHFVTYDIQRPAEDIEFAKSILEFLSQLY